MEQRKCTDIGHGNGNDEWFKQVKEEYMECTYHSVRICAWLSIYNSYMWNAYWLIQYVNNCNLEGIISNFWDKRRLRLEILKFKSIRWSDKRFMGEGC